MMYPVITLEDDTEIVHSHMLNDERVKVYIERPDEADCFHHAVCYAQGYEWEDVFGFTDDEINYFRKIIESTAHLIIAFSREGGYKNAAGL